MWNYETLLVFFFFFLDSLILILEVIMLAKFLLLYFYTWNYRLNLYSESPWRGHDITRLPDIWGMWYKKEEAKVYLMLILLYYFKKVLRNNLSAFWKPRDADPSLCLLSLFVVFTVWIPISTQHSSSSQYVWVSHIICAQDSNQDSSSSNTPNLGTSPVYY